MGEKQEKKRTKDSEYIKNTIENTSRRNFHLIRPPFPMLTFAQDRHEPRGMSHKSLAASSLYLAILAHKDATFLFVCIVHRVCLGLCMCARLYSECTVRVGICVDVGLFENVHVYICSYTHAYI